MGERLLIYGATGYTGKLIARQAAERGLSPVLAGAALRGQQQRTPDAAQASRAHR